MTDSGLVKDIRHFEALLDEAKGRLGPMQTNTQLMAGKITELAASGRLSYVMGRTGLYFLVDEGSHYLLTFYIAARGPMEIEARDKPLMVKLIVSKRRMPPWFEDVRGKILSAGFNTPAYPSFSRLRMRAGPEILKRIPKVPMEGYSVQLAQPKQAESIHGILLSSGMLLELEVPGVPELERLCARGEVNCAVDADGEVLGACQYENGQPYSVLVRYAVAPAQQNKKIGSAICRDYLERAFALGYNNFEVWVSEDNHRSLHVQQRLGYSLDGVVAYTFVRDK